MPHLRAFLDAQRHRHVWVPLPPADGIELERCECGAVRPVQRPETD
jgi:hypothetical protein